MNRSTTTLSMLAAALAIAGCSKSGGTGAAAGNGSAQSTTSSSSFGSRGAGACDKYLTSEVFKSIIGADADERKVLSAQACEVRSTKTGGSLTITLKDITPQSFHAFRNYLSGAEPLPGVGDSALVSIAPTVTAIKGNMGCDFDATRGSSPAALSDAARGRALGDICNRIFAGSP